MKYDYSFPILTKDVYFNFKYKGYLPKQIREVTVNYVEVFVWVTTNNLHKYKRILDTVIILIIYKDKQKNKYVH
jgi:hypothetical protein